MHEQLFEVLRSSGWSFEVVFGGRNILMLLYLLAMSLGWQQALSMNKRIGRPLISAFDSWTVGCHSKFLLSSNTTKGRLPLDTSITRVVGLSDDNRKGFRLICTEILIKNARVTLCLLCFLS